MQKSHRSVLTIIIAIAMLALLSPMKVSCAIKRLPIVSSNVAINRTPVVSSALASAGYDADTQTLEIEFRNSGSVYQYSNIPPELFEELITAPSIGRYYNRSIKGRYRCIRIR